MTPSAIQDAIRTRFLREVEEKTHPLPVFYDNAPHAEPTEKLWCRWTVLPGETSLVSLGIRTWRTIGTAIAQVFAKSGTGTAEAMRIADAIAAAFRHVSENGVQFRAPSITNVGLTGADGGAWFQINVSVPWYADDTEGA